MKIFRRSLPFASVFLLLCSTSVFAADLYVTQQGIPPYTNSLVGLNTYTNVNPGDVVHLCGTFTNGVDIARTVGTPLNPVTFYFEPGANFTAPAWGQKYNNANSYSNGPPFYLPDVRGVVIDGGVNGVIQATANASGWLQWSNRCDGITMSLNGGSFEIRNLTISNLYQRFNGQDEAYTPGHTGNGAYLIGGQAVVIGGSYSNSSIHNCNITGTGNLIAMTYNGNTDNVQIYSNTLSHCSFGIQIYGFYQSQGTGWKIWANKINPGTDWSGNNTYSHINGIILNQHQINDYLFDPSTRRAYYTNGAFTLQVPQWGNYGSYYNWTPNGNANNTGVLNGTNLYTTICSFGAVTNTITLKGTDGTQVTATLYWLHAATNLDTMIYRNYFGPTWGTNASNWIGVYADMPSGVQRVKIFNNIVVIDNVSSPSLMGNSIAMADDALLANNTLVQLNPTPVGVGCVAAFGGGTVFNNLFYNFNKAVSFNTFATDPRGWGWFRAINYNCYYGLSEWMPGQGAWPNLWYNPNGFMPIFPPGVAIYRRSDGYETASSTYKPRLDPLTYKPLSSDRILVGKGTNLTAFAIANGIPELTNDYFGNPRPSTGAWTIGAFEVPYVPSSLLPPSNLNATTNQSN